MDSLRNAAHGAFKKAAEAVLPPLAKSQFEEKRVLTPDEFVRAGDYLVRACPTWSWESGDPKKARPYLPPNKQYLVTRGVPCLRRAADLERAVASGGAGGAAFDPRSEFALSGEDEGWTATHRDPKAASTEAAGAEAVRASTTTTAAAGGEATTAAAATTTAKAAAPDDDGVPDLADLDIADEATVSASTSAPATTTTTATAPQPTTVSTRTYDLHVTYDQYYRVPRMWLVGFDESGSPLRPEQVLEDVSEDHARKTITVEAHPHGASAGVQAASIHPCRHAEVMKRLAERAAEGGGGAGGGGKAQPLTVERYLVLFLKFIASVVPTIQYDYTMET